MTMQNTSSMTNSRKSRRTGYIPLTAIPNKY